MIFDAQCINLHHMGVVMSEVIRTTVPVTFEVHQAFKRLADAQGISLGRAMSNWLTDTADTAEMVAAQMVKAKAEPVRVLREYLQVCVLYLANSPADMRHNDQHGFR